MAPHGTLPFELWLLASFASYFNTASQYLYIVHRVKPRHHFIHNTVSGVPRPN